MKKETKPELFIKVPNEEFKAMVQGQKCKEFIAVALYLYSICHGWRDYHGYCETSIRQIKEALKCPENDRHTKRMRNALAELMKLPFLSFGSANGNLKSKRDITKTKPNDILRLCFDKNFFNDKVKKGYSEIYDKDLKKLFETEHVFSMTQNNIVNLVNVFFFAQSVLFSGKKTAIAQNRYPISKLTKELHLSDDTIWDCMSALQRAKVLYFKKCPNPIQDGVGGTEFHVKRTPFREET